MLRSSPGPAENSNGAARAPALLTAMLDNKVVRRALQGIFLVSAISGLPDDAQAQIPDPLHLIGMRAAGLLHAPAVKIPEDTEVAAKLADEKQGADAAKFLCSNRPQALRLLPQIIDALDSRKGPEHTHAMLSVLIVIGKDAHPARAKLLDLLDIQAFEDRARETLDAIGPPSHPADKIVIASHRHTFRNEAYNDRKSVVRAQKYLEDGSATGKLLVQHLEKSRESHGSADPASVLTAVIRDMPTEELCTLYDDGKNPAYVFCRKPALDVLSDRLKDKAAVDKLIAIADDAGNPDRVGALAVLPADVAGPSLLNALNMEIAGQRIGKMEGGDAVKLLRMGMQPDRRTDIRIRAANLLARVSVRMDEKDAPGAYGDLRKIMDKAPVFAASAAQVSSAMSAAGGTFFVPLPGTEIPSQQQKKLREETNLRTAGARAMGPLLKTHGTADGAGTAHQELLNRIRDPGESTHVRMAAMNAVGGRVCIDALLQALKGGYMNSLEGETSRCIFKLEECLDLEDEKDRKLFTDTLLGIDDTAAHYWGVHVLYKHGQLKDLRGFVANEKAPQSLRDHAAEALGLKRK